MDFVTYILGAGFSAPAGIPVMSNFIAKSKDLYFADPEGYGYFKSVFAKMDKLAKIKNYFKSDLFNIEEVLSILETERQLVKRTSANSDFESLIKDVVNYYTPPDKKFAPAAGNWEFTMFGHNSPECFYSAFFASLCGLRFTKSPDEPGVRFEITDNGRRYTLVTMNYDLLPERFECLINDHFVGNETMVFVRDGFDTAQRIAHLAKIHGSADADRIIPPTWSKIVTKEQKKAWQVALQSVSRANHIRIIGYSLPTTDNYISYLLKAAIMKSEHLKSIDVICLDCNGDVKTRYDTFVTFRDYRFYNADTVQYLSSVYNSPYKTGQERDRRVSFDLEKAHHKFVENWGV